MTRKFADISSLARHVWHALVMLVLMVFGAGVAWQALSQAPKHNKTAIERVEAAQIKAAGQIGENAQAITKLIATFDERGEQEKLRMERIETALFELLKERRND